MTIVLSEDGPAAAPPDPVPVFTLDPRWHEYADEARGGMFAGRPVRELTRDDLLAVIGFMSWEMQQLGGFAFASRVTP